MLHNLISLNLKIKNTFSYSKSSQIKLHYSINLYISIYSNLFSIQFTVKTNCLEFLNALSENWIKILYLKYLSVTQTTRFLDKREVWGRRIEDVTVKLTIAQFPPCWFSHYSRTLFTIVVIKKLVVVYVVQFCFCRKWSGHINEFALSNENLAILPAKSTKNRSFTNYRFFPPEVNSICADNNLTHMLTTNEFFKVALYIDLLTTESVNKYYFYCPP